MENHQNSPFDRPSQVFNGIRFVLLGYDPLKSSQVSLKFVNGGAVNVGKYDPNCTHVIVDKLVYDDPVCVAARRDGKILVSSLWADHSFDVGVPVDVTSVMYRPVRDLNGIPGAKSLVICLTGYQREDREDIMTMVGLMGAQFSKPLIANKVTHLICYKFEGTLYILTTSLVCVYGCKRTERTRTRSCSCSFVKKYMCSRTLIERDFMFVFVC
ncbi:putative BRCT domain-containing protein [Helianthus anomalus]